MTLTALVWEGKHGFLVVQREEVPQCISRVKLMAEVRSNFAEAYYPYLVSAPSGPKGRPAEGHRAMAVVRILHGPE